MESTARSGGIALAGNILVDIVKKIDRLPERGMLSSIYEISRSVGGCVPNTGINLAKIDSSVPLYAIGRVGRDSEGEYVLGQMKKYGMDVSGVKIDETAPTSFSDVMTEMETGERTFYHARGANARFAPEDIDLDSLKCDIFHIGYILLLDIMDKEDEEYGTKMARLLHDVQERGIKTSIDCVSDSSGKFREKVVPALKYCDYAIMNEIEGCGVSGYDARNADGTMNVDNMRRTAEYMMNLGVKEKVILHSKEAGYMLDSKTGFRYADAIDIDPKLIKGKVGAGDSFCAGCLCGIFTGVADEHLLDFASGAAVCNLLEADSISGMKPRSEIMKILESQGKGF